MRHLLAVAAVIALLFVPWFATYHPAAIQRLVRGAGELLSRAGDQVAAIIISHRPKTVDDLQANYHAPAKKNRSVKVLIVPGHEPDFGGTEFGMLKERDMVVELSEELGRLLSSNGRYQVTVARDAAAWNPVFASYFAENWNDIIQWQQLHKQETSHLIGIGQLREIDSDVIHNAAAPSPALRLYGLNKWANENDIDIVLHVHLNDYPRKNHRIAGQYSGFAIYVPEEQYYNSSTTKAVAESIFHRLARFNPVSDLRAEQPGIVEDQDLIAVGAFNSVNAASMLLEYAYIYEPQFTAPDVRSMALKDFAFQTYLGLQDFFDASAIADAGHIGGTAALPYSWDAQMSDRDGFAPPIFALQSVLMNEGVYPPEGKSKNECPRTGKIGPCTKEALAAFQAKHDIADEKGYAGPRTLEALNAGYGITQLGW